MVFRSEKLLGDDHIIDALMGERPDLGSQHLAVQIDALGLLGKYDRHMKMLRRHARDADAGGLDRQDLVDGSVSEEPFELFPHLIEKLHIHLMVQEGVHLQHPSRFYIAVFDDSLFQ